MSENVFWVNSTKFRSYSCRNGSIPVESSGIQAIPVPFQCIPVLFRWNPMESGRTDAFLQESVGHQKVQWQVPPPPLPNQHHALSKNKRFPSGIRATHSLSNHPFPPMRDTSKALHILDRHQSVTLRWPLTKNLPPSVLLVTPALLHQLCPSLRSVQQKEKM